MLFRWSIMYNGFMLMVNNHLINVSKIGYVCNRTFLYNSTYIIKKTWIWKTEENCQLAKLYSTVSKGKSISEKELKSEVDKDTDERISKKKDDPVITLIGSDDKVNVLSLSEADKLAKRRSLKLIKVMDPQTNSKRPIYKLMTGSQFFEEDKKVRIEKSAKKQSGFKGEKLLQFSQKINENDVKARLKHISKWLSKSYEVRIVISGEINNMKNAEHIYDLIEDHAKAEGRIVQKRTKGSELRFSILPPKKDKEKTTTVEEE